MDSISKLMNNIRVNDPDFKDRVLDISSVYNREFDSDTILELLAEDTIFDKESGLGVVYIPNIMFSKEDNEYKLPKKVAIKTNKGDVWINFPESIGDFAAICKAFGLNVQMNTRTANRIYGIKKA